MSDHIPFEIQAEIIKRLPIKSLLQFRSVSKPWKSLIESSEFINGYHVHNSQPKRLLVSYRDQVDSEIKYVSIDDDDTFPQRKCYLNAPMFIKQPVIIGSSHGLLCLYGDYQDKDDSSPNPGSHIVVLWNPSIRKSVAIEVPNQLDFPYDTVVGFGVCPHTNDPKLVKVSYISKLIWDKWESISCVPLQVEVFTLSSRVWRIPFRNLPRKSICFGSSHIVVDGFIYWMAFDRTTSDDEFVIYDLIISFDLTGEEFREIYLPNYLAQPSFYTLSTLSISKLRDSLVVLECSVIDENLVYGVWMMEHGVPNSFTKLFTIDAPEASFSKVLGFRENGKPMLEMLNMYSTTLEVYEPSSKHIKDIGVYGQVNSLFVSSYMETLTLLDHPYGSLYSNT